MKKNRDDFEVVPFPKIRRGAIDLLRKGKGMHIIHALVEMDVTKPRQYIREYRARTGETLSFTAFIASCLGRAVDENKYMHAYRKGRGQLILFDEVDVNVMIEREAGGRKMGTPHIIRAANKKTFREIHQEIRTAQAEDVEKAEFKGLSWYVSLPGFIRGFLWRILGKYPRWWKKVGGTVGITAVGMFGKGIGWGLPISVNTLSLTLGGIAEKPGVVGGRIEIREYLSVTISFDHDIVDGAPAARFTRRLKELIESGHGLIHAEGGEVDEQQA